MLDQDRLTHLETTVAFQDRTIQDLNQVILRQQARIERLEARLDSLLERPGAPVGDPGSEPPPPHY